MASRDGPIKAISRGDVHRLQSGQVVLDLQTAVKELVENSLDAGATNIEVRFKEHGADSVEVVDNGSGISPDDYEGIALRHHTSKLSTFSDLASVTTFGFRGEALSSLCALSDVTIITATEEQAPMGTVLELESSGRLKSSDGKSARQRGSTVRVSSLFSPLPVRRREFERNIKREYAKALGLLQAYALISKGVRLSVNNTVAGKRSSALTVPGNSSPSFLSANVTAVFGAKAMTSLQSLQLQLQVSPAKSISRLKADDDDELGVVQVEVVGLISKPSPGNGRTSSDRQFFYINGRPCSPTKVAKAFNEVYRSFNSNQYPFVLADFRLPTDAYDVNVSPDKRTIFLHSEAQLVETLKTCLEDLFQPARSTYAVQGAHSSRRAAGSPESQRVSGSENEDEELETFPDSEYASPAQGRSASPSHVSASPRDDDNPEEARPTTLPTSQSDEEVDDGDDGMDSGQVSSEREDLDTQHACRGATWRAPAGSTELSKPLGIKAHSSPTRTAKRPVQMTLSTSSASWALGTLSTRGAALKRRRTDQDAGRAQSHASRLGFTGQLTEFAMPGSQVGSIGIDKDEASDAETYGDEPQDEDMAEAADEAPESVVVGRHFEESPPPDATSAVCMVEQPASEGEQPRETISLEQAADGADDISTGSDGDGDEERSSRDEQGEGELDDQEGGSMGPAIQLPPAVNNASSTAERKLALRLRDEVLSTTSEGFVQIRFDIDRVRRRWRSRSATKDQEGHPRQHSAGHLFSTPSIQPEAGINTVDAEIAERELARVISKPDFAEMEVVGQFNLGFIIVRRRKTSNDESNDPCSFGRARREGAHDLFIVDQHAADEKYNFERLQAETKITSQRLFSSRALELPSMDELLAIENAEIIRANGFDIDVDEDAPTGRRVKLVAQPMSKEVVFGVKDLEELLFLLRDAASGQMVRCSKARAMFAMRACRRSVMVGKALSPSQMTTILRHMGTMEQPWNCPHGRPTMRHLASLNTIERVKRPISWSNLSRLT